MLRSECQRRNGRGFTVLDLPFLPQNFRLPVFRVLYLTQTQKRLSFPECPRVPRLRVRLFSLREQSVDFGSEFGEAGVLSFQLGITLFEGVEPLMERLDAFH